MCAAQREKLSMHSWFHVQKRLPSTIPAHERLKSESTEGAVPSCDGTGALREEGEVQSLSTQGALREEGRYRAMSTGEH